MLVDINHQQCPDVSMEIGINWDMPSDFYDSGMALQLLVGDFIYTRLLNPYLLMVIGKC